MLSRLNKIAVDANVLPALLNSFRLDEYNEFEANYGQRIQDIRSDLEKKYKADLLKVSDEMEEKRKVREEESTKQEEEIQQKMLVMKENMKWNVVYGPGQAGQGAEV